MLTTKRYEYLPFEEIRFHPDLENHRTLDTRKVTHYEEDILKHGLLEPLVVWEKRNGEYFLVGGFHRHSAITSTRSKNPGYFDRVYVRVVAADPDEIRALNLKLNADRLDVKITDYFDTVIHLNNANWAKERIAAFLDRSVSWIEDIIRYVPIMNQEVRSRLENGQMSWDKAKRICRAVRDAPAGMERQTLQAELETTSELPSERPAKRPLNFRTAKSRLRDELSSNPSGTYSVQAKDLLALLLVLEGKEFDDTHLASVRRTFPALLETRKSGGRASRRASAAQHAPAS